MNTGLVVFIGRTSSLSILQPAPLFLRARRFQPGLFVIFCTDYYTGRRLYVRNYQEKETIINHVRPIGYTLYLYLCSYPAGDFRIIGRQLRTVYHSGNSDVFFKENRLV